MGFTAPNFGILTASDLPSINYRPPPPYFCNISEPLPKIGTCIVEIVAKKHLIIKVCLYFAFNKDFISSFKGHNVKVCPFRDVPPLQNLRVWGGHCSSVSAFTATAFGDRFTVGTHSAQRYERFHLLQKVTSTKKTS